VVEEMARRLSMTTRRELKQAVGERYRVAGRWERRQILDEFTRVTGYHRKHALRVLHRPLAFSRPCIPRGRSPFSTCSPAGVTKEIWKGSSLNKFVRRVSGELRKNRTVWWMTEAGANSSPSVT
jgi:hypothetical protein